jgi:histidine triad (HIT) family protein
MPSIFSKIVSGEIPCYKIAEDEKHLAFLDIQPLKEGHTLVIPKKEIDYIFDIEDEEIASLIKFAKKVARGIKKVIPCEKIGMTVIGLEVPHAHIHLIPIEGVGDMNFNKEKQSLDKEKMISISEKIRTSIEL